MPVLILTIAAASMGAVGQKDEHGHVVQSDSIVVTAPFARERSESLTPVSVLTQTNLARELRTTIGDTLARQPGVSATSFGPSASRPILRGFQGERVRILTDGIGSFDVSNTSVDHAVVINPLLADRIEVVRGPASLLYGSSAIGGVVNVLDARIPRTVPDEPVHLDALASYGSAANERSVGSTLDVPVTDKVVLHADGSWTKSDDLEIGGNVLSRPLRAQALASGNADIEALADLKGKLPNSAARTWNVGAGAAVITDTGNMGFSVSRYDSVYGVPVRYSLTPGIEGEAVRLDVKQWRADARAETDLGSGFFERLRIRAGFADYKHAEIDDTGAIGTQFFEQGWEGRAELVQADRSGWKGAIGGQVLLRNMHIVGDEKFLPKNETQQYGVFTVQDFTAGPLKVEVGARFEHSIVDAQADADIGNPAINRSFSTVSGSAGASYGFAPGWRIGTNITRSARAPSAEELFANGPHAGTQAFEIGNPSLNVEKSWGVDSFVRYESGDYKLELSAFKSWFSNYIDQITTGAIEDDLPVYQYIQGKARYWGFEAQGSATLAKFGDWKLNGDALGDYVRATIVDVGPAPRIPPMRFLGGLELKSERLSFRGEVEHVTKQDRVSINETPTDAYTVTNLSAQWTPSGDRLTVTLAANNLFDVDARRHASFLKDYAPLAGRDFRISVRTRF